MAGNDAAQEPIAKRTTKVGRLAPSPTGLLHLGHAFSLLVAWWSARSQGGRIVLRIDDIDHERAHQKFVGQMIDDLKWLGLDWDGPAIVSSERAESHAEAVDRLSSQNQAYACVCSRSDIRAMGAPQQGYGELRYPGTCRGKFSSRKAAEEHAEKAACLRFVCPEGTVTVTDGLYGRFEENVQETIGDFIVQRRSGDASYQVTVVVDDHLDGVNEVVRGRDLLPSTLRQMQLSHALQLPIPSYLHVPLICDETGRRLAKREDALSLAALRERGIDSSRIASWAARVAGQDLGCEELSAGAIITRFDRARLVPGDVALPTKIEDGLVPSANIVRI